MIGIRWQDERCLSFSRRKQSLGIEVLEEILGIKRSNSTSIDEDRRRDWHACDRQQTQSLKKNQK